MSEVCGSRYVKGSIPKSTTGIIHIRQIKIVCIFAFFPSRWCNCLSPNQSQGFGESFVEHLTPVKVKYFVKFGQHQTLGKATHFKIVDDRSCANIRNVFIRY